jgi:hypothetical protein
MKQLLKETYEAPMAEVLEVKMEGRLLDASVRGVNASREDGYDFGGSEEWGNE